MAELLSLPNEMLMCIYMCSSTIESAVSLSTVNKRLYLVWLEHMDQITESILRRHIPDYEDAVDLAILEDTRINDTHLTPSTTDPFPIRLYLSKLLHNASLASSATAAWLLYEGDDNYQAKSAHISSHAAYYLMRKVVFSHRRRSKRVDRQIFSTFRALSEDAMRTFDEFLCFLTSSYADHDERLKHGIPKPEEDWTEEDEWEEEENGHVNTEDWKYLDDILDAALAHKFHDDSKLKEMLCHGVDEQR